MRDRKERNRTEEGGLSGLADGLSIFLFTDSKLLNHCTVPGHVLRPQVIQKAPTLSDHPQQASARMMVLGVDFEVVCQIVDPLAEEGYLHFRRTCIGIMSAVGIYDFNLSLSR